MSDDTSPKGSRGHHLPDGRFRNPQGSPSRSPRLSTVLKFSGKMREMARTRIEIPEDHVVPREQALTNFLDHKGQDSLTWLGHASFLIRLDEVVVLTDPYLSKFAGPARIGPRRFVKSGISLRELPEPDILVISHNHYDHLDEVAISRLKGRERMIVVCPLKLGEFFRERGFTNIVELDWDQTTTVRGLQITALPVIHWSRRSGFDRNKTLWAGFGLRSAQHHLFFGGDSGYGPVFEEIGEKYGPFDTALLGIGAYEPREIMHASHTSPEEAVTIGKDIGAQRLVGMHWGTVILSIEPPFEPPVRFRAAGQERGYEDDDLWVMAIGETRPLPKTRSGN